MRPESLQSPRRVLPAALLLLSALTTLTTACGTPAPEERVDARVEQLAAERWTGTPSCESFDAAGVARCTSSALTSRERRVIKDAATWEAVWAQAWAQRSVRPALPPVDFSKEVVVLAAMGQRRSGGHLIEVVSVEPGAGGREVTVLERSPGASCLLTGALTQPFTAVRVPSAGGELQFVDVARVEECGR
jgi:hypothetical protein